MATRNLLHKSKLENFKNWLIEKGWKIETTKGQYEVLRANKANNKTLIIFTRNELKEHYTVPDSHIKLIYSFLNQKK